MIKKLQTKHKILKVTLDLMQTKGLENISMREIARLSNITTGAIYHYYDSKNDIILGTFASLDDAYSQHSTHFTNSVEKDILTLLDLKLDYFEDMGWKRSNEYLKVIMDEVDISDEKISPIYKTKINEVLVQHGLNPDLISVDLIIETALSTVFYWVLSKGSFNLKEHFADKIAKLF